MGLVNKDFTVPISHQTKDFLFDPLTIHDVVEDYANVMSNIDHLQGTFGEYSNWPSSDLTMEQNLIDLGWHHKEFQNKSSFAYVVRNPNNSAYLGCLYFYPSLSDGYDVDIYTWLVKSACDENKYAPFLNEVKNWVSNKWTFKNPKYCNERKELNESAA